MAGDGRDPVAVGEDGEGAASVVAGAADDAAGEGVALPIERATEGV